MLSIQIAGLICDVEMCQQWRERLVAVLRSMNGGDVADQTLRHIERAGRVLDRGRAARDIKVAPKVGNSLVSKYTGT